jgi:hypothetical protein
MSDSWQTSRPVKGSSERGSAEGKERDEGETKDAAAQQQRFEYQRPPAHVHPYMHPPSAAQAPPYYGYPPGLATLPPTQYLPPLASIPQIPPYPYPVAQSFRYPPPPEHYAATQPQDQAYWGQHHHQQMRMPQYPLHQPPVAVGRGEYPFTAGAATAASGTLEVTADSAAAIGSAFAGPTAMGATAGFHMTQAVDTSSKRTRKNVQSRARAAQLRSKIEEIKRKPEEERTEDEIKTLKLFEGRREKKNERSRGRAVEKKSEVERILAIPEDQRTEADNVSLQIALKAKLRKNEGDRLRRERIKRMGLKSGVPVRSRGRPKKQVPKEEDSKISEGSSPAPPPPGEARLPSPGAFMSLGLMPTLGFPSPVSFAVEGGRSSRLSTSLQQQVQAPSDPSLLGLSWSQPHLSQRPFQAQQSRSSQQAGASRMMFGGKPEEVEEQEDV